MVTRGLDVEETGWVLRIYNYHDIINRELFTGPIPSSESPVYSIQKEINSESKDCCEVAVFPVHGKGFEEIASCTCSY